VAHRLKGFVVEIPQSRPEYRLRGKNSVNCPILSIYLAETQSTQDSHIDSRCLKSAALGDIWQMVAKVIGVRQEVLWIG
jgi:hypothetical protein